jgi:CheY-like chemotaxis protein
MADDNDLRGASLLLVDDAPANLDVLCALLETEGVDVALATDGPLALEIAANTHPDLILLDVMMPQMDGFEVCRRLKMDPVLKSIPVLFITARDQLEDVVAGFRAGGVDFITKGWLINKIAV